MLKTITQLFIYCFYKTVLNINNNNKRFLEQQISISELFLKDHVTQDWRNDAENPALITGINYILQYIQTESSGDK